MIIIIPIFYENSNLKNEIDHQPDKLNILIIEIPNFRNSIILFLTYFSSVFCSYKSPFSV